MLQKRISLFLLFVLCLIILGLLRYLHATYEGFQQQQQQTVSLDTNPDAEAFFDFHGKVCDVWNQVIDAAMKSDQTPLDKEDYIQQLEAKQTPPAAFVRCETPLTASTDLQILANSIPSLQVYQNTLTFLVQEIQKILDQTTAALQGKSQESFVNLPPSFQAPFQCLQQQGTGLLQCTTQLQQVQPAAAGAATDPAANAAQQQQQLLQQILQQIQPIVAALPTLQESLQTAQTGLQKLNDYKQKAESGELVKDINVPST
jgi:hypothetical protein